VERKVFLQERTQPSDRLEAYHISWAAVSASRSASTADGLCQASRIVVSEKQTTRDGSTSIIRNRRAIHAHRCSDALGLWTRLQILNLESFTCSWFESSSRSRGQNSTKRTKQQTHAVDQAVIFAQKVSPPLLRGHHSGGWLGLAAPGIASPSDGLSKLPNYCCSVNGTKPGCRKEQIISSARPRPRDFLSRSCFSKRCSQYACQTSYSRSGLTFLPLSTFPSNINNDLNICV